VRSQGDVRKVRLARRLRTETSVTWKWIADELHLENWSKTASRLAKLKIESEGQNEFRLE
jgi:hypothetical protein